MAPLKRVVEKLNLLIGSATNQNYIKNKEVLVCETAIATLTPASRVLPLIGLFH